MNVFDIEKYFDSPEKMEELLKFVQTEYFDMIDYHANLFIGGALSTPGQVDNSIEQLTGIYMMLEPIYEVSETIKKNREEKFYMGRKIEIENKGEKFVSTSIDKEASNFVANERRVRNVILGKLNACDKAISTCQSKMKKDGKEMNMVK